MRAHDDVCGAAGQRASTRRLSRVRSQSHPLPASLPTQILTRLRAEGIETCEQWLALSTRKRAAIFGITRAHRAEIDAAIAAVMRETRE